MKTPASVSNTTREFTHAAGGIVWRRRWLGHQILLVHRRRYGDWVLPKGKVAPGETHEQAAIREVREETGFTTEVAGYIGSTSYLVGNRVKCVLYFLLLPVEKGAIGDRDEVDRCEWLSLRVAMRRLTYEDQRRIVAMAFPSKISAVLSRWTPRRSRLLASIAAYEKELNRHPPDWLAPPGGEVHWLEAARGLLVRAKEVGLRGRLEEGWHCLLGAARLEAFGLSADERQCRAIALRAEAKEKLKNWRGEAVVGILGASAEPRPSADCLYYAALLRDEATNNIYFREHYYRNQLSLLLVVLLVALFGTWGISEPEWFDANIKVRKTQEAPQRPGGAPAAPGEGPGSVPAPSRQGKGAASELQEGMGMIKVTAQPPGAGGVAPNEAAPSADQPSGAPPKKPWEPGGAFLAAVMLFGVMGGAFSAILSIGAASTKKRIPEQIVDSLVTVLRPALGAAGALVAYVFLVSNILDLVHSSAPAMLAIAFVAGFSDRLVLRGVRTLSGDEAAKGAPAGQPS